MGMSFILRYIHGCDEDNVASPGFVEFQYLSIRLLWQVVHREGISRAVQFFHWNIRGTLDRK